MEQKSAPGLPPRESASESEDLTLPPRPSSSTSAAPSSSGPSKRERIVLELLSTERSYVTSLETLVECFAKPLTLGTGSNSGAASLLTPSESRSVFANADHLLHLNSSLLQSLERELAQSGPSQARVGKILFEFAPFFRVYMNYIDRYEDQMRAFTELCQTKQGLEDLVEQLAQNPKCRGLALKSHLIMPIQRIPRYKMLLHELAAKTSAEHPDSADIFKAKEKISDVAKQINDSIKQQEHRQVMLDLRAAIGDGPDAQALWQAAWPGEDLIERYRHLIRIGRLVKRSRTKKSNKSMCVFVLLSDTLIYGDVVSETNVWRKGSTASTTSSSSRPVSTAGVPLVPGKISLRAVIPLWTTGNRCHANRRQGDCAIEFLSDVKSFDIVASTESEADGWYQSIADAITACSQRLMMLEQRKKWSELRTAIIHANIDIVKQATTSTLVTATISDSDALFELSVLHMLKSYDNDKPRDEMGFDGAVVSPIEDGAMALQLENGVRSNIVGMLLETTSMSIKKLDEEFLRLLNVVSEEGDSFRASAALDLATLLLLRVSAKARDKAMISANGPGSEYYHHNLSITTISLPSLPSFLVRYFLFNFLRTTNFFTLSISLLASFTLSTTFLRINGCPYSVWTHERRGERRCIFVSIWCPLAYRGCRQSEKRRN